MFCGAIGVLTGVSVDTSSDTVDGFGECGRSHNVSPPRAERGASPSAGGSIRRWLHPPVAPSAGGSCLASVSCSSQCAWLSPPCLNLSLGVLLSLIQL